MRLRNLIPEKIKLQLYRTAILSHLTYCSVVWHFIKASDTRKLERIQERALRTIYAHNILPIFLKDNHNLRNADFILPRFNTVTSGKYSVTYLGPKLLAGIPNHVKSVSLKSFQNYIRNSDLTIINYFFLHL